MSDPSTRSVLYEESDSNDIGTVVTDGIRLGLVFLGGSDTAGAPVLGAVPSLGRENRWPLAALPTWAWPTWSEPRYHQRLKPVYDSLRTLWGKW